MTSFIRKVVTGIIVKFLALLLIILTQFFFVAPQVVYAATTTVGLGTGANFAILSQAAITDTNPSVVVGDVGASPISGSAIHIPSAEVTGTIYAVDGAGPSGSINNPGLLTTARNDVTTAYNDAAGRTASPDIGTDLAGATLTSGVYHAASGTFQITGGGTLTLNGQGDANSVFIFKTDSTLVTSSSSKVVLTNGAQACNVFWQVGSSATLGTSTSFVGNILAYTSITDNGGSTVNGRFFAGSTTDNTGAVTLNATHITKSTCAAATSSSSGLASSTAGSESIYCPPLDPQLVAPTIIESKRVSPTSIFVSWAPYSGTDTFNVRYGFADGGWLYSTDVTGFSTTIGSLPANQPIWFSVAPRSSCTVGSYGPSKLVGGPGLPNTGFAPQSSGIVSSIIGGFSVILSFLLNLIHI